MAWPRPRRGTDLGGGIYNGGGTVTLKRSIVSGNSAGPLEGGGGIYNEEGTVTLMNSTVSDNHSSTGAGIYNASAR